MRSRNRVVGPETRDFLSFFPHCFLISIVARGCKNEGMGEGLKWAIQRLLCVSSG